MKDCQLLPWEKKTEIIGNGCHPLPLFFIYSFIQPVFHAFCISGPVEEREREEMDCDLETHSLLNLSSQSSALTQAPTKCLATSEVWAGQRGGVA